jgi:hypothetical protein
MLFRFISIIVNRIIQTAGELKSGLNKSFSCGNTNTVTIIDADAPAKIIDFKEFREYRDLFIFLVWRDIKVMYA